MSPIQSLELGVGRRKQTNKKVFQTAAHYEHHTWIRLRTDNVAGEKRKQKQICTSNYMFTSLAEIVLWYPTSFPTVAMVPNATETGTYCQTDLGRCT